MKIYETELIDLQRYIMYNFNSLGLIKNTFSDTYFALCFSFKKLFQNGRLNSFYVWRHTLICLHHNSRFLLIFVWCTWKWDKTDVWWHDASDFMINFIIIICETHFVIWYFNGDGCRDGPARETCSKEYFDAFYVTAVLDKEFP